MSYKKSLKLAVLLVVCAAATGAAQWKPKAEKYEKVDSASIRSMFGEGPFTIMKKRTKTANPEATSGIIVEAPPSVVWKAVTDYGKRPEVIQGVLRIENLKWEGKRASFTQRNSVKFSFVKFAWDEMRVHDHTPETRVVFYEPPKLDVPVGGYELISMDGGKATLLIYSYIADLRSFGFPVGTLVKEMPMVEEILMSSAALMVITGTKDYAEKLAKGK